MSSRELEELERRLARCERAITALYLQLGIEQSEIDAQQAEIEALRTGGLTYPATVRVSIQ